MSFKASSLLSYEHLTYEVPVKNRQPKKLIEDVSVEVAAGELLAIMGPSGSGKTTLLDLMSFRKPTSSGSWVKLNGEPLTVKEMHRISSYVEQEDALLGVLTVRESITYSLRLHSPLLHRREVNRRVETVITALGLQSCANQQIGTPISRGISGGQKRRVTAACAMVTYPRILFLDEVTSGLDSTSAREVMAAIRRLAMSEGMIVLATIHQPSGETLAQFSNLLMLSGGKTCYSGPVDGLAEFFEKWGRPVPRYSAPVDFAMNFLNEDFGHRESKLTSSGEEMREFFLATLEDDQSSLRRRLGRSGNPAIPFEEPDYPARVGRTDYFGTLFWNTVVLSERSIKNYSRNLLAYGVRAGMYAGMGFMLATIWIRLGRKDSTINDRLSVHFYSAAFLAFMSVAGIPGFLEERAVYYRESKNGLYTTLPFVISNTLVNIPFLFACTIFFSFICYWAIGLHAGGAAFFRWMGFLFLAILVAESQVLIISAILPVFVAALAISAFINGFWMSVGGYFIKARTLPRFWYYSFHFMDYQKYAFELLTNSDFRGLTFDCPMVDGVCGTCAYQSSTPETCTVSGEDVLKYLEIEGISYAKWTGIMVAIFFLYRIALYIALKIRSK